MLQLLFIYACLKVALDFAQKGVVGHCRLPKSYIVRPRPTGKAIAFEECP